MALRDINNGKHKKSTEAVLLFLFLLILFIYLKKPKYFSLKLQ